MTRVSPPQVWRLHNRILLGGSRKETEGCGFLRNFPPRNTPGFEQQIREGFEQNQNNQSSETEKPTQEGLEGVIYSSAEADKSEGGED